MENLHILARAFDELIDHNVTIKTLKSDVSEMKADVQQLKVDVSQLKADVRELKADVAEIKEDIKGLKRSATVVDLLQQQFLVFQEGLNFLIADRKRDKAAIESIDKLKEDSVGIQFTVRNHILDKSVHLSLKR